MKFWIIEIILLFSKRKGLKVGFIPPEYKRYNQIMPSTRIRVLDIIIALRKKKFIDARIFFPFLKYDIVVFQKKFCPKSLELAKRLKAKGTKIVLDINVNYFDKNSPHISILQYSNIVSFSSLCTAILCSSEYLKQFISNEISGKIIKTIEEAVPEKYFLTRKRSINARKTFIWSGFSIKALALYEIESVLIKLYQKNEFSIIIISDTDPKIRLGKIPVKFIKYSEKTIVKSLLKGDVFLAPRNLKDPYNLGHTFTKIGVAMALGIPVIASAVPSYKKSPAIICNSSEEWEIEIRKVLTNNIDYLSLSNQGINYCRKYYSIEKIRNEYCTFFRCL